MDLSSRPSTLQTRPRTVQSRPATTRPLTATSTKQDANYVVAVVEGRGIGREIGIAALDRGTGSVMLVQLADCQTYVKTLHQLYVHTPSLILFPDTYGVDNPGIGPTSLLVEYMRDEFPNVPLEDVNRKYWNSEGGIEFINQLCVEDDERAGVLLTVSNQYYALSAACALFKYAEHRMNIRFASGSLRIRYIPVEGTMLIDTDTVRNLELVGNLTRKKSKQSLFGILDFTFTAMGARLLRANILSPLTGQALLDARLDAVEELVRTEDKFTEVREALKMMNKLDLDKLIASLAAYESKPSSSAKIASVRVSQMLNLRTVIQNLPLLRGALAGSRSQLLCCLHDMLSDERLVKIETLIQRSLNEEVGAGKGGLTTLNARVYAVKANCNRLLDVARETYKENIGDIYRLNELFSAKHNLPLSLLYQETGFAFTLKKEELQGELPSGFINATVQKGKWSFSCMALKKINARMKDALDEALLLSDKIVQDLVTEILGSVGALYKASEAVALLDMLWAFSHCAIMRNYIRPEFTGTIAIKSGRHPVLETLQTAGEHVPNDLYCDNSSSFQLIHGPNMSGKSTYLRQTALLVVMAMCGSFVPAEYASFRVHDSLLTRLSDDDDLEKNLSTFASEMVSSTMIIGLASWKSLVLVDELGRGTSPQEGVGIAYAMAEKLIAIQCFTFFTSHFHQLSTALSRQPTVVALYLSFQKSYWSTSNFGLTFQYKVVNGTSDDLSHYGLGLARLADLPESVLQDASKIAEELTTIHTKHEGRSESKQIAVRRKALLKLRTTLTQLFRHSKLPDTDLLAYIERVQLEVVKTFRGVE